ncbi:hypothetical protein [Herbidospora daliensis]|uniref:hypothetical protein n=1 Tax=Herbidospora daliensis TaxID=295585 RepID=UPI0012FCECB9|nr:hypothetical protein [Herbidospora daliensis]
MRAIGYTVAWCGATALAVGVAWFGVSDVLRTALGDGEPLTPLVVAAPDLASGVGRDRPVAPEDEPLLSAPTPTPASSASRPSESSAPGTTPGPAPGRTPGPTPRPTSKPTSEPASAPTSGPTSTPTPGAGKKPAATRTPSAQQTAGASPSPVADEKMHTFTLKGGRATVAVGETDCRIVSATPAEGWELQTWTEPYWLRITFLKDGKESSAFCTWNALPPRLDTYET